MGRAKQFATSSFWLTVSIASVILVGAVYRPIIGRLLGPTEYGQYSFIQTFIAYFLILAFFGTRSVVVREIGRDPSTARLYVNIALKLRSITTLAAIFLCCLIGFALQRSPQVTTGIFVLSLSIGFLAVGDLIEGVLVAIQKSFWIAVGNTVGGLFKLAFGIWALKSGYGLIGVLWVFVAASFITTGIGWLCMRDILRAQPNDSTGTAGIRYVFKESVPFVVLFITAKVYAKNDILMLTFIRGDMVTGLYSAAYIFVDLLISVGSCFTQAAFPMLAKIYGTTDGVESSVELSDAYERLHKHMLMIFLPLSVLLMTFSSETLLLVFGREFAASVAFMQVLSWIPATEISCLVSGNFLCATYRQSLEAKIAAIITVIGVVLTVLFIYWFGAMGAAVATLSTSLVNAVMRYIYVRRSIGAVSLVNMWGKPMVCAGVLLAALLVFSDAHGALRLAISLGACLAVIVVIRPYDSQDRRLLMSVVKR